MRLYSYDKGGLLAALVGPALVRDHLRKIEEASLPGPGCRRDVACA